jgi:hypothetical protein
MHVPPEHRHQPAQREIQSPRDAFAFSGDKTGQSVQSIGEAISMAVEPPDTEILSSVLFLLESIAEVGEVFEVADEGVAAGIGLLASPYDLGTGIASSVSGTPVGQQITAKADAFATEVQANVASAEEALDGIRAVAISDYGRLQAIRQLNAATNPTSTDLEKRLTAGASSYFASELIPETYQLYRVKYDPPVVAPLPDNCVPRLANFPPFKGGPDSAWVPLLRYPDKWESLILDRAGTGFPPTSVTDAMFKSQYQASGQGLGYGIEKTTWFWELGAPFLDNTCVDAH